jgi:basic amino acid/polyamine antiporter, APA family
LTTLARKLHTTEYFTLSFGTMVGVGWLVVMDDWLRRGGPLGAILGFALGGAALVPIGYVYGRWVEALPDAGSEIAYTDRAFGPGAGFAAGWTMTLAYLIVCPWEAVAIGKIAAYIFPALDSFPLYHVAGIPVYLPHLAIGLLLTAAITALNFRGIRFSAAFQNWAVFGVLALFLIFAFCGLARGSPSDFVPLFHGGSLISILLMLQVVPYFMTGFEAVPKCAEEASPEFHSRGFARAIFLALGVGVLFYTVVIAAVAYVQPWQPLTHESFATAVAFERAFRARWIVDLILAAALVSLVKIFNGNFVAASRLLFALGRRGLVNRRLGVIHVVNQTPTAAVLLAGLVSAIAVLLGESILIPITEVGSLASAVGWLATCAAYYRVERAPRQRFIAALGMLVGLVLILIKVLPFVPGHFTVAEYAALGIWITTGWLLRSRRPAQQPAVG